MNKTLYITILLILILFINLSECFGQNNNSEDSVFACKGKIEILDSSYYLVLSYSVNNDDTIHILEKRVFSLESEEDVNHILFWRLVRGFPVRLYLEYIRQPLLEYVNPFSVAIDKNHPFQDTVLLDSYIPFEKGEYLVCVYVWYKHKGERKNINSDRLYLDINFVPRNSL